jgi:hypothetical protein
VLELNPRPVYATPRDRRLFVGFEAELERTLAALSAGLNILILGRRGAGKTSLLYQIRDRLLARSSFKTVYVDGLGAENVPNLLIMCWSRATDREILGQARVETLADAADIIEQFRKDVAVQADPSRQLVILLDGAPNPDAIHTIFGKLRDAIWRIDATWVVAGDWENRAIYLTPPADAFFSTVLELNSLTATEAKELLRRRASPTDVPDRVIDRIVAAADGTPRNLIQLATDVLVNNVDLVDAEAARARLAETIARLGRPAAMAVAELATLGPVSAGDARLLTRLGWTRPRAVQVLGQLEKENIVDSGVTKTDGKAKRLYWLRAGLRAE